LVGNLLLFTLGERERREGRKGGSEGRRGK
jgi:hypothetical protein